MKKSTSKKSAKGKKRHAAAKNPKSHAPKPSPKLSKTMVETSTPKLAHPVIAPALLPACDGSGAETHPIPKMVSPQARLLEQSLEAKKLHDQGASMTELAEKYGRSKSHVRDLLKLAGLSDDLRQPYLGGKLGRKKALAAADARKKASKATQIVSVKPDLPKAPPSPPPACKEAVEHAVVASSKGKPPEKPRPSPPPEVSAELYKKIKEEATTLVVDWVRSTLAICDWEAFFKQVGLALYGVFPWLFTSEAPKPGEINLNEDPLKVIERCKIEEVESGCGPDVLNNNVKWFARWIQRVILDRKLMKEVISAAETTLIREAWKTPQGW
jgi:hypothetical protein